MTVEPETQPVVIGQLEHDLEEAVKAYDQAIEDMQAIGAERVDAVAKIITPEYEAKQSAILAKAQEEIDAILTLEEKAEYDRINEFYNRRANEQSSIVMACENQVKNVVMKVGDSVSREKHYYKYTSGKTIVDHAKLREIASNMAENVFAYAEAVTTALKRPIVIDDILVFIKTIETDLLKTISTGKASVTISAPKVQKEAK